MESTNRKKRDTPVRLDMTFEQALKKALNTPLPKKEKKKSNDKVSPKKGK